MDSNDQYDHYDIGSHGNGHHELYDRPDRRSPHGDKGGARAYSRKRYGPGRDQGQQVHER